MSNEAGRLGGGRYVPVGVAWFDAERRLVGCDRGALDLADAESAEALVGLTPRSFLLRVAGPSRLIGPSVDDLSDAAEALGPLRTECVLGDGRVVEALSIPGHAGGSTLVLQDVTSERQELRRLRLQRSLARRIASAAGLSAALHEVLHALARHAGWHYGESWIRDDPNGPLALGPIWTGGGAALDHFARVSADGQWGPERGLVGRVLASGESEVVDDIESADDCTFRRRPAALEAGLVSVFAVPMRRTGLTEAVFLFGSRQHRARDPLIVELIEELTPDLAQLLERKRMEDDRSAAEQRYANLLATAGDAIVSIDEQQVIRIFNEEAERIFGWTRDEVVGRPLDLLMPADVAEQHGHMLREFAAGKVDRRVMGRRPAIQGRRKDGSLFPAEATISRLRLGNGTVFTAVIRDVTERRRIEEAARMSEERYRDLVDVASDWIWESDADGRITYVSERFSILTGCPASHLLGRRFEELAFRDGDAAARLEPLVARRAFRGMPVCLALAEEGRPRWFRLSGKPRCDEEGAFLGYRGAGSDMTAEREALERADRAREQLLEAVETISEAFVVYDKDDRLVLCNHRFRELYPWAADIIGPGVSFLDLAKAGARGGAYDMPEGEPAWLAERLAQHADTEGTYLRELAGGRWLQVRNRRTPSGDTVGIRTDITELKRAERALAQAKEEADLANRAKSEFLANMSHELRTPLNAVIGFSEIMLDRLFGPLGHPRYEGYVRDIAASGRHLLGIINDLLDLSRIEAGAMTLDLEEVAIRDIVEACQRMVADRLKREQLSLAVRISEGLPTITGDKRRIKQVVLNLLSNAVKFTPTGGSISVEAVAERDGLRLVIVDTGIGMSQDQVARAFEPFRRGGSENRRNEEGVGLGLSVSRSLCHLHGGSLELESTLGVGTRVTVRLPVVPPTHPAAG